MPCISFGTLHVRITQLNIFFTENCLYEMVDRIRWDYNNYLLFFYY